MQVPTVALKSELRTSLNWKVVIFGLRHLRLIYDLAAMACLVKGKGAPFAHMADAFHLKHIDPRHKTTMWSINTYNI